VRVSRGKGGGRSTVVTVEEALEKFGLPGLVLRSSGHKPPLPGGTRWPEGLVWTIEERLKSQGAAKGRALGIWQGDQLVAICAWHLHESGPPVIFDLGCRTDLPPQVAKKAEHAVLLCLRAIAGALARDTETLRWTDRPLERMADQSARAVARSAVRGRAKALKFLPSRPRPKWLANRWVVERRF